MSLSTPNFAGLRVLAFESRRAEEMARLIERYGGIARVSPSMREVEVTENRPAAEFAHRVITGQVDVVIFLTGVGVRHLLREVEQHMDPKRFLEAISDIPTIVRGPKPLAVLRELGVTPTYRADEPNTWREVLAVVDKHVRVSNQTVGVIEYGEPNTSLIAGLEARGAKVEAIRVYRWDLPEDSAPLQNNIHAICQRDADLALFTSGHQAVNLLRVADGLGCTDALRQSLAEMVVTSIGPTTSETLRELELPVDLEPEHSKMGQLVAIAAERGPEMLKRKRLAGGLVLSVNETTPTPVKGPWDDSLFMKACRGEAVDRTPIWLMRQAGRYLPEYQAIRDKNTFLELCKNPALCAEVMISTVNRLGVDAAIIFSDLLPMLEPMGIDLEYSAGEGPVIHNPIRSEEDLDRFTELKSLEPLSFVMETVRQTRAGLANHIPLIGFAGAPFTLASYVIEGGASRSFLQTKRLMYGAPAVWDVLMGRLARSIARYLNGQIAAGAQAVQLFDSWVGCLGPDDYRRFVLPYTKGIIASLPKGVPVIHFITGNPALLPVQAEAGGDVIGVDWRVRLDSAWSQIGPGRAIQGNLDPTVLLADRKEIERQATNILRQAAGRPGHIFNLGHGVLPATPVENVLALIDIVRKHSSRAHG
jgi:uroporphyrinogen decarboxylase